MTQVIKAIWTPLMLGGIVPGVLLLAVLGLSLATHGFTLANDHSPASIGYRSVTNERDGDSDDASSLGGQVRRFPPSTGWMLDIG